MLDRAEFLRGIAAGLRGRSDDIGQIWPRESGALHLIAQHSAAGTAAGFDYYADLAKTFPFEERAQPSMGEFGLIVHEPVGRRRCHHPLERPDRPHHLQAGSGPPGRLHGCAQVLAGGPWRCLRVRRNRRGRRPSRRRPQRGDRRSRGLRVAGPRSSGGQDHLHRLDRRRAARSPPSAGSASPGAPWSWAASPPPSSSMTWT